MTPEQIQGLTRIGHSLYGDWQRSANASQDALTLVAKLDLSDDSSIERASRLMVERAERNPPSDLKLLHPFFRLAPVERFLITVLHLEKWSYHRIGRSLGIDSNAVPAWAWSVRMKFAFELAGFDIEYPRGPGKLGVSCPDFNASDPWTARFLDDSLEKADFIFIQNHLVACETCRKCLDRCRNVFFKIEEFVPSRELDPSATQVSFNLIQRWSQIQKTMDPSRINFKDSFRAWISIRQVQIGIALVCFYFVAKLFQTAP